jgi:hypothetical protein
MATTIERDPKFAGLIPAVVTLAAAAATKYIKGTFVCRDANGRAAVPAAGLHAHGVAVATFDNTSGANDAMDVEAATGVFMFNYTGTAPKPGEFVYVSDNDTVTLTASTNGIAGVCTEVRSGKAHVWVSPIAVALAISDADGD